MTGVEKLLKFLEENPDHTLMIHNRSYRVSEDETNETVQELSKEFPWVVKIGVDGPEKFGHGRTPEEAINVLMTLIGKTDEELEAIVEKTKKSISYKDN